MSSDMGFGKVHVENFLSLIEDPIFQEDMQEPMTLYCGHVFDKSTIAKVEQGKNKCPNCDETIAGMAPAYIVKDFIERGKPLAEAYLALQEKYEALQNRVQQRTIESKIDAERMQQCMSRSIAQSSTAITSSSEVIDSISKNTLKVTDSNLEQVYLLSLKASPGGIRAKEALITYLKSGGEVKVGMFKTADIRKTRIMDFLGDYGMFVTRLDLSYIEFYHSDFEWIRDQINLEQLRELHINRNPRLTDYNMELFKAASSLEILDFTYTNIDGSCFANWNLEKLKGLYLMGCGKLKDANLCKLRLSSLENFRISATTLDGSFFSLLNLPNLKYLDCDHCPNLQDRYVKVLKEKLSIK